MEVRKFKVMDPRATIAASSCTLHIEYIFIILHAFKNWCLNRNVQCGIVMTAMGTITLNFLIYVPKFSGIMLH